MELQPNLNLSLKDMPNEIWVNAAKTNAHYQVSNLGRIKSVKRTIVMKNGAFRPISEKILRLKNNCGYLYANIYGKWIPVHRIVLSSFLNESNLVVDHLNEIKSDNRLENLEWVTVSENNSRAKDKTKTTSKYTGVSKKNNYKKCWYAGFKHKGFVVHLGVFDTEEKAYQAYTIGRKAFFEQLDIYNANV
jgi:hypothetical protein